MNAGHSLKKSHFFVIFLDKLYKKKSLFEELSEEYAFILWEETVVSKNKLGLLLIYQLQWEFTEKKNY